MGLREVGVRTGLLQETLKDGPVEEMVAAGGGLGSCDVGRTPEDKRERRTAGWKSPRQ